MRIFFIIIAMPVLVCCSTRPEPLVYGKDACFACKMTLVDKKFGGEIITKKGKVYKFDDLNCMVQYYKSGAEPKDNVSSILVMEFDREDNLIPVETAYFVKAFAIRSPMGGQTAAFAESEKADQFNVEWKGERLDWKGVVQSF